jgi:nucleotide-binding universal stress UspA family protein
MTTILVPTAGSPTDASVFRTALLAARPLDAHLAFLHVYVEAAEAITHTAHAEFARGAALTACLGALTAEAETRSAAAQRSVRAFCRDEHIPVVATPHKLAAVTASWSEALNDGARRILTHARHSDLVVVGRPRGHDGLTPYMTERLLLGCGRPVLFAPAAPPAALTRTVMVCWNETATSARALTAAMPLLRRAERVVIAAVDEAVPEADASVQHLVTQLAWSGVAAAATLLHPGDRPVAPVLTAFAHDCRADLVVMGGYSHSPLRELLFGGCTRAFLEQAELPVLMLH